MLTRQRGLALTFATAGLALFAAWQLWHFEDPNLPGPVTNIAVVPFSMFATACAVGAALRTDGGRRVGWLCMAVGFSGWVIGDVSFAYYAVAGKEPPFPSIVDYTYLLLPLSVCVAAVFGPGRRRSGIRLLLEGVIVSASTVPGGVVDRPAQALRGQRSLGSTVRDVRGLPRRQSGPDHRALRAPVEGAQGAGGCRWGC